ncbi:hypothetical protein F4808DRAFT_118186 [Astrocystis sublimbata]|nr:hypothetical protein F4808DRAFT_118186 [Astrocystis sublimbata]
MDDSVAETGYEKPRTRQRIQKNPPPLTAPDINQDAAERKRVLNVLAQRRYRERKRQEKGHRRRAASTTGPQSTDPQEHGSGSPKGLDLAVSQTSVAEDEFSLPTSTILPLAANLDFESGELIRRDWLTASVVTSGTTPLSGLEDYSPDLETQSWSTVQSGASVVQEDVAAFLPQALDPSGIFSSSSTSPSRLTDYEASHVSFPDSYYLPVNELALLKAFFRIAMRLRCNMGTLWELDANSPFNDGTHLTPTTPTLPEPWRPTLTQSNIPHHPLIDLLPWPSVRDRVILIFSVPDDARPPVAAGPLGIAQLAYDIEDTAEGVRIWGDDPCEPTSWEVGQVLFERWWFIFDREIVSQSNYWRKLRGANQLAARGEARS